jgi:hypothetical protein
MFGIEAMSISIKLVHTSITDVSDFFVQIYYKATLSNNMKYNSLFRD